MNAENNTGKFYPKTLTEAVRYFSDPQISQDFFVSIRWPDGVTCPHCGSRDVSYLANQRRWQCRTKHPRRQFSAKVGTIFEDSPLSLEQWMVGVWLETNAKNGISSYEVSRALGVTQKTAWFMMHRVRLAMHEGTFGEKLGGEGNIVEADETFIGGKSRNMHKDRRARTITGTGGSGKLAVMGLLERHSDEGKSKVRTQVLKTTRKHEVQGNIREHVEPGSYVFTDSLRSYVGLGPEFIHDFVDHAETYVRGNVHTNGLENFWALFKRCVKGTHVSIEPFHTFRYLDAEAFRFNNRELKDGGRFVRVLGGATGKRVTYKTLTGKDATEDALQSDSDGESENAPN